MQIPADDERRPAAHGRERSDQAIMLSQPTGLPVRFRHAGRQLPVGAENIRIPLTPLAGDPLCLCRRAKTRAACGREQIPVNVIAIRHDRIRLERQRTSE